MFCLIANDIDDVVNSDAANDVIFIVYYWRRE